MSILKFDHIKSNFYKFNSYQIFFLSILICILFYSLEGIVGVDRFYHPDSAHYLTKYENYNLESYIKNPLKIFSLTYYHITNLFGDNYYLLILLNFILYSLSNVFIYQKVFKRYFDVLSNLKLVFLFYLLFLDPYRLHLASHILKETFLIFFMIILVLSNIKIIKILSVLILETFRPNSWIYALIFFKYSNLIKFIKTIKKIFEIKLIYQILAPIILLLIVFFIIKDQFFYDLIETEFEKFIKKIKYFDNKQMPLRTFDQVAQFKDFDFPVGFILKNISWPIILLSGFFTFFVSSILFKFLGIIIIINNVLVYKISKKSFISLGLIIILLMISVYTSSYTAMFRYSYIALYSSLVYFFLKLDLKNCKRDD